MVGNDIEDCEISLWTNQVSCLVQRLSHCSIQQLTDWWQPTCQNKNEQSTTNELLSAMRWQPSGKHKPINVIWKMSKDSTPSSHVCASTCHDSWQQMETWNLGAPGTTTFGAPCNKSCVKGSELFSNPVHVIFRLNQVQCQNADDVWFLQHVEQPEMRIWRWPFKPTNERILRETNIHLSSAKHAQMFLVVTTKKIAETSLHNVKSCNTMHTNFRKRPTNVFKIKVQTIVSLIKGSLKFQSRQLVLACETLCNWVEKKALDEPRLPPFHNLVSFEHFENPKHQIVMCKNWTPWAQFHNVNHFLQFFLLNATVSKLKILTQFDNLNHFLQFILLNATMSKSRAVTPSFEFSNQGQKNVQGCCFFLLNMNINMQQQKCVFRVNMKHAWAPTFEEKNVDTCCSWKRSNGNKNNIAKLWTSCAAEAFAWWCWSTFHVQSNARTIPCCNIQDFVFEHLTCSVVCLLKCIVALKCILCQNGRWGHFDLCLQCLLVLWLAS